MVGIGICRPRKTVAILLESGRKGDSARGTLAASLRNGESEEEEIRLLTSAVCKQ